MIIKKTTMIIGVVAMILCYSTFPIYHSLCMISACINGILNVEPKSLDTIEERFERLKNVLLYILEGYLMSLICIPYAVIQFMQKIIHVSPSRDPGTPITLNGILHTTLVETAKSWKIVRETLKLGSNQM